MALRFLILDTYYSDFLKKIRQENKHLDKMSYNSQLNFLLNLNFGTSDYYSYNLKMIGHEAFDIIANDEVLQRRWASENGLKVDQSGLYQRLQSLPFIHKFLGRPDWVQIIALEQIKTIKPDVLYIQDLSILNPGTLKKAKIYIKLLVGQIACPLPSLKNLREFDLLLTSFPHYVEFFRKMSINSEYFKIGFEQRVLNKIKKLSKKYNVTFVGGISPSHKKGLKMLNYLANNIKIDVWGYGKKYLLPTSNLYKLHHGEAWAMDMYKKLAESKITINRHIDVAKNYANNMRLYEATGMGAMLLTDKKDNLNDLFKIGKEVVAYDGNKDLLKKIKYYLSHDVEREKIAKAGQKRTLKEHTYKLRMQELTKIINKYIRN